LRALTGRLGILLVYDEVVTGFRVAWGGATELYGVTPDLVAFGKIIGGGHPLAAVAGRREVLGLSNPRAKGPGYTYISGTLNGNPLAAAAGLATLEELEKPGTYARLHALGRQLREGLAAAASKAGLPAQVLGVGPMANLYVTPRPIRDYRDALSEDRGVKQRLQRGFREAASAVTRRDCAASSPGGMAGGEPRHLGCCNGRDRPETQDAGRLPW
jgi:glutamate-1-semialdehyde 2,1-aminomutase